MQERLPVFAILGNIIPEFQHLGHGKIFMIFVASGNSALYFKNDFLNFEIHILNASVMFSLHY